MYKDILNVNYTSAWNEMAHIWNLSCDHISEATVDLVMTAVQKLSVSVKVLHLFACNKRKWSQFDFESSSL
ncbi:unnamed protein product [Callosobruchus maculatus]|uniref:Uncharacterized protein n=1 Tax=Callosobruchus maculatus TaxID=64391 RepID=A0A653CUA5_CALMS|nr:unnamed protein product [Callosobruchus maculatus]